MISSSKIALSALSLGMLSACLVTPATSARQADPVALFHAHAEAMRRVHPASSPPPATVTALTGSFSFIDAPGTDVTLPFGIAPHASGGPLQIAGYYGAAGISGPLATPTYGFTLGLNQGKIVTLAYRPLLTKYPSVVGHAINDSGVAAGWWVDKRGNVHGFTSGAGSFAEVTVPGATDVYCNGISNAGIIAGSWDGAAGGVEHAFLSQGGKVTLLPDYPGALQTVATGSNASGTVVGFVVDSAGNAHSAIYQGGGWTLFDPPGGGFSLALGINAGGVIVGSYCVDGACDESAGYLLQNGTYQSLLVPGQSFGSNSDGTTLSGISDDGLITGAYEDITNTFMHGFLFTPGATPK